MTKQNTPEPRWLPISEAVEVLGLSKHQIQKRGKKGLLPRKKGESGRWLYACALPSEPTDKGKAQEVAGLPPDVDPGEWTITDRYVYIPATDKRPGRYLITVEGRTRAYDEQWIRALWRAYTYDGGGLTISEITKRFKINRQQFTDIQNGLRFTHTSAPWTMEEVAQTPEEELVHDALMAKLSRAHTKAQQAYWRQVEQDAEKWRRGPGQVLQVIETLASELELEPLPRPVVWPSAPEFAVVLGCSDFHIGKKKHRGPIVSPQAQVERLQRLASQAIDVALSWGTPTRWYVQIGGDLLHVDGASLQTSGGTAQGPQTTGTAWEIWKSSVLVMEQIIAECAKHAPVIAPCIPGNHDRFLSLLVAGAVQIAFRPTPHVQVDADEATWRVYAEGQVPLLFDHGCDIPAKRLPMVLATYLPPGCNIKRGVVFRGHLHEAAQDPVEGVPVITFPSPGSVDDWHARKAFTHRGAMGVYKISDRGPETSALVYAEAP